MRCNQISLGTAQFGSNYGITNNKKISFVNIKRIINLASKNNIKFIDTAYNYGDAEKILGKIGVKGWKISSKFPTIPKGRKVSNWIENKLFRSLKRLNVPKIHSLLVHDSDQLKSFKLSKEIFYTLEKIKNDGYIKKIGVSIYNPNIIKKISNDFKIDIIQAPANIFDSRIFSKNIQTIIKEKKIELEIRSIFLQGLILQDLNKIPKKFQRFKEVFKKIDNFSKNHSISKTSIALSFLNKKRYNRIVVGTTSVEDLKDIIKNTKPKKKIKFNMNFKNEKYLINPSLWNKIK